MISHKKEGTADKLRDQEAEVRFSSIPPTNAKKKDN